MYRKLLSISQIKFLCSFPFENENKFPSKAVQKCYVLNNRNEYLNIVSIINIEKKRFLTNNVLAIPMYLVSYYKILKENPIKQQQIFFY